MMEIYARIQDGRVFEFYETGEDIDTIFGGQTWVDVSGVDGIAYGWRATLLGDDWAFTPLYVEPPPDPDEILIRNTADRDRLLTEAALAIAPLQDAVDLDDATADEEALLKKWTQYRVAINRIDLTYTTPDWPNAPV